MNENEEKQRRVEKKTKQMGLQTVRLRPFCCFHATRQLFVMSTSLAKILFIRLKGSVLVALPQTITLQTYLLAADTLLFLFGSTYSACCYFYCWL
ncbi:hypothetical protein [Endozoicomonas arenosclerae]|uniref:hypothetical protein n=1 Tax=Endozoicomonas arenosclerae TaxID=1633495 RepID=UPI00078027A7|nr:hypothetical protein [Endozoicomonas arenosclerae]